MWSYKRFTFATILCVIVAFLFSGTHWSEGVHAFSPFVPELVVRAGLNTHFYSTLLQQRARLNLEACNSSDSSVYSVNPRLEKALKDSVSRDAGISVIYAKKGSGKRTALRQVLVSMSNDLDGCFLVVEDEDCGQVDSLSKWMYDRVFKIPEVYGKQQSLEKLIGNRTPIIFTTFSDNFMRNEGVLPFLRHLSDKRSVTLLMSDAGFVKRILNSIETARQMTNKAVKWTVEELKDVAIKHNFSVEDWVVDCVAREATTPREIVHALKSEDMCVPKRVRTNDDKNWEV